MNAALIALLMRVWVAEHGWSAELDEADDPIKWIEVNNKQEIPNAD